MLLCSWFRGRVNHSLRFRNNCISANSETKRLEVPISNVNTVSSNFIIYDDMNFDGELIPGRL